jgi:hypothetical protein
LRFLLSQQRSPSSACGIVFRQLRSDGLADLAHRRQNAEESERSGRDDFFAVDVDLELAVVALLELDFFAEPFTDAGRRTGGLNAGYSIPAASDLDGHECLLCTRHRKI